MARWDVAVIGAGIAGLTAARTAATHGLRTVAFEQLAPGGQLINLGDVTHYPGLPARTTGPDLAGSLLEAAMSDGVEVEYAEVTAMSPGSPAELCTADGTHAARAVVVATGATPGRLDVPGAAAWAGRGLSECASCDGPLYAGRRVVVVGDDEWAAQEAAELSDTVAHVTVLVPGLPGWSSGAARRLTARANLEVRTGAVVVGLSGDSALEGVTIADGTEITATGAFVYTGKEPRTRLLGDPGTAPPGVLVAGDVRAGATPYLISAAADGLRAGLAAASYLSDR